jgi:hypothetical protein
MTPLIAAALDLVARRIPVFACDAEKHPLTRAGFKDASASPAAVRRMFSHPAARLIGVPTGARSGADVLDVDYRHCGGQWEQDHVAWLPETRIHQTMSGGRHYLFLADPNVRNSASRIAPGIDTRGTGGYVVVPPSEGYSVIHDAPIAPWPDWLLVPGLAVPPPPLPRPPATSPYTPPASTRLEGYLRRILDNVSAAADGEKHVRLRNAGLALGGFADELGMSDAEVVGWLLAALPPGVKDWKTAQRTAEWALAAGRTKPLQLEDRPGYAPYASQEARA